MSSNWIEAQSLRILKPIAALHSKVVRGILLLSVFATPVYATEPQSVNDFVVLGLANNARLQARNFDAKAAEQALIAARAAFRPSVSLDARYLRAEGGRTIDFPIGDALNPVYQTLNGLTAGSAQPSQFPSIENLQFDLLREREQDTRLKLSLPLYSPALDAALQAAAAQSGQAQAAREVFARLLVRDIRRAYFGYGQAQAALEVLQASELLLQENLRINRALVSAGSTTRDRELRANAELLGLQDRMESATNALAQARRYLNFLVQRELDTAVASPAVAQVQAATEKSDLLDERAGARLAQPELYQLNANIASAQAGLNQARALTRPSVSFGVDAGIQGTDYGFGSGKNFATAAIVVNWRFLDFGQARAQRSSAKARIDALHAQREALVEQLELAVRTARDDVRSAGRRLSSAKARREAAEEGFRITSRKRDAGAATQVEFLDAERALSEASLALNAAVFDQANQLAELELALAAYPLPPALMQRDALGERQ